MCQDRLRKILKLSPTMMKIPEENFFLDLGHFVRGNYKMTGHIL